MRRPYVFLYREERDPCERALINLATARTELKHHGDALNVPNTFRYSSRLDGRAGPASGWDSRVDNVGGGEILSSVILLTCSIHMTVY